MRWLLALAALGGCKKTCVSDEQFFADNVQPILDYDCVTCHTEGALAGSTR